MPTSKTSLDEIDRSERLLVTEERLEVGTRSDDVGGVRVRIEVEEVPGDVSTETVVEEVVLERVPIGRTVAEPSAVWRDGDALVVPVYEEVAVVERRLVLKEEVRVTTRRVPRVGVERLALRRERAIVERQGPDGAWRPVDLPSR